MVCLMAAKAAGGLRSGREVSVDLIRVAALVMSAGGAVGEQWRSSGGAVNQAIEKV